MRGGSFWTEATINKSIIALGIYRINFILIDKLDINLGFEMTALIKEHVNVIYSSWAVNQSSASYSLLDKYDQSSKKQYVGLKARFAYDFKYQTASQYRLSIPITWGYQISFSCSLK